MKDAKVIQPIPSNNLMNWWAGLIILIINKVRHEFQGYTSPRGFPISEIERGIQYDMRVVDRWDDHIKQYLNSDFSMAGSNVLELGPGADLGVGLYMLGKGVNSYHSLDVNNLVKSVPSVFYDKLFEKFEHLGLESSQIARAKMELAHTLEGNNQQLNYVVRQDFDITIFQENNINLVVSNASFEHFDDPLSTLRQVSKIVQPGTLLAILVDMATHTRWIKQRDPLNIYRYSDSIYNTLKFSGSPNRVRPIEYSRELERNGWTKVQVVPTDMIPLDYTQKIYPQLAKRFRDKANQMEFLSVMILAQKV